MEKINSSRNEISGIELDGVVTGEKADIERAFLDYYSALFGYVSVLVERFKSEFLSFMPRLDDDMKEFLEAPITVNGVKIAIEALNRGKSPGPDGLSAAFYRAFKHEVTSDLTNVYNELFYFNVLPPSFLTAHTAFIPKTEDVTKLHEVTAYSPISLTNVDCKIFMKILARRLQSVITELVGPHQTYGIKGRTIFTNIQKARSVLECCDVMQSGVGMLQIDLSKAFDRVPHDGLLAVLDHVNVGKVIREGARMAFSGCTAGL